MSASRETNETARPERIAPAAYLLINLGFWGFCLAQYLVARLCLGRTDGIAFFFVALAVGFTLVCVFDFLCGVLGGVDGDEADREMSSSRS